MFGQGGLELAAAHGMPVADACSRCLGIKTYNATMVSNTALCARVAMQKSCCLKLCTCMAAVNVTLVRDVF